MEQKFFLSSFLISYAILLVWFLMAAFAKDFFYSLQGKFFQISKDDLVRINYLLLGFFKILVIVLFLIPYLAMWVNG